MTQWRIAYDLACALRGPMRKFGPYANPDPALAQRDDHFEAAEADYRRAHGLHGRPPAASAFYLHGREYVFDHVARLVNQEIQYHAPQRPPAAVALEKVLHNRDLQDHHLDVAVPALLRIYKAMRPVGELEAA